MDIDQHPGATAIRRKADHVAEMVMRIIERDGAIIKDNIRDEIEAALWDITRPHDLQKTPAAT